MGIIHIPRTIAASLRGAIKRRFSPLSDQEISLVGTCDVPHIYSSRAGILDVDAMGHMNNASYLQHAELARWEWGAFGGSLAQSLKTQTFFLVTASMIRFRREIGPWQRFDIETRLVGLDNRNLWVYQTFHHHVDGSKTRDFTNGGNEDKMGKTGGKILAQILTQAVLAKSGKGVIDPRPWLEDNCIYSREILDEISNQKRHNEMDSIFDEKTKRFLHLEDILRSSAASYDEKVPKQRNDS